MIFLIPPAEFLGYRPLGVRSVHGTTKNGEHTSVNGLPPHALQALKEAFGILPCEAAADRCQSPASQQRYFSNTRDTFQTGIFFFILRHSTLNPWMDFSMKPGSIRGGQRMPNRQNEPALTMLGFECMSRALPMCESIGKRATRSFPRPNNIRRHKIRHIGPRQSRNLFL